MQAIDASENVDFNLHTHVECNSPLLPDSKTIVISTHALTWSATMNFRSSEPAAAFQLTHSRGVRQLTACRLQHQATISTHALTWSATTLERLEENYAFHFNSRTHVECDTDTNTHVASSARFQLTHSRGVRLLRLETPTKSKNFNSRTHVECDQPPSAPARRPKSFQLTHSRGVRRLAPIFGSVFRKISTHALTWSATCVSPCLFQCTAQFQLTHSRGVRPIAVQIAVFCTHFNSRTHVECDV